MLKHRETMKADKQNYNVTSTNKSNNFKPKRAKRPQKMKKRKKSKSKNKSKS